MRRILKIILKLLASRVIRRYKPIVVGITGSVGKSTTKEIIFSILSSKFRVAKNDLNFNQEIGVPLAILSLKPFYEDGDSFWKRSRFLFQVLISFWLAYGLPRSRYPEILVLELAADRPGDIGYLTKIVRPTVGVITAIGEIPVHVEFYASPEALAKEKSKLVKFLPAHGGLAVLNYDDQTVLDMRQVSKATAVTFGFSEAADIWASEISYFLDEEEAKIGGLSFKIHHGSAFIPVKTPGLIGRHQIYSILAAVAVGLRFGVNLVDTAGILENIELPPSRMNLLNGIKNSFIINDSYNASPLSSHAALDALKAFGDAIARAGGKKARKIAVMGDMKELGKYEVQAHQAIGALVPERADILITVGLAAKFIAEAAADSGMVESKIFSFSSSEEAKSKVQEIIKEGDAVLIKGSRAMKMEKILEEIIV